MAIILGQVSIILNNVNLQAKDGRYCWIENYIV